MKRQQAVLVALDDQNNTSDAKHFYMTLQFLSSMTCYIWVAKERTCILCVRGSVEHDLYIMRYNKSTIKHVIARFIVRIFL
jgi:hypothetical protein